MAYIKNYNFISLFFIVFASVAFLHVDIFQPYEIAFKNIALFLNIIALFLALYFGKSKIFTTLLIPLFFALYMYHPSLLGLEGGKYSFWYMYPIILSIGFLVISILKERAIFSSYGLVKILFVFFLLGINYLITKDFSTDLRVALETELSSVNIFYFIKMHDFAFSLASTSLVFTALFSFLIYPNINDKALFWMLVTLLMPALFFENNFHFLVFYTLSSLLGMLALLKETHHLAYIDTLTNIPARRALEDEFLKLSSKYTIAMVDIDFFKKFNDTYGHDVGDEVLKLIAHQLSLVKGGGKAFRYGGEEFTILFKNKMADEAYMYLEEIRENIAKRGFSIRDKDRPKEAPKQKKKTANKKSVKLSVSIGVANSSKKEKNPYAIMKLADTALYKAKESGRNCTIKT